jgi:DHA2 family methylenomycin A resistance protein-like MFS transporter
MNTTTPTESVSVSRTATAAPTTQAATTHPHPQPHQPSPTRTLVAALLGFSVIGLDASAVNVALPSIEHGLGGSTAALQWIVDAFMLMLAALLLSAGAFSDRYGATRVYAAGLGLFTLSSMACGIAPSLGVLIGARLVQGAAAAVMLPSSLALVRQAYPDAAARARAIALWTVGGALATAVGPVVGGAFTSDLSWRAIFFLNLPVGLVILIALARIPHSPRRPAPLDPIGQFTAVLGLGALTYSVIEGGANGFGRASTLVGLLIAVLSLTAFILHERRVSDPMLPLGLFASRTVSITVAIGFAVTVTYFGLIFVVGLFLQDLVGLSAVSTGLLFLPMSILVATANMASARAAGRFGPRVPIVVGQLVCALGLLALAAVIGTGTNHLVLAALLLPLGFGLGFTIPSVTAMMISGVAPERAGMAGGVFNSCRQTGGALAVAGYGALVAHRATFMTGLHVSLLISAALLLAGSAAALALPKR